MAKKRSPRDLKKKSIGQLNKTLWPLFALYVKLNHSTDGRWCKCFTCDKPIEIHTNDCQAGHWQPRTKSSTKYSEDNVKPQCFRCNHEGEGETTEFERRLIDWIGKDAVEALIIESRLPWKWQRSYLIEKIEFYREELKRYDR